MKNLKITLWDLDAGRIADIERNLYEAMREYGVKGSVSSQSEPPLVSRMNLGNRVPALEVDGLFWTLEGGRECDARACREFIRLLLKENPAPYLRREETKKGNADESVSSD